MENRHLKELHQRDVEELRKQFIAHQKLGHFSLTNHTHPSNVTRPPAYKTKSQLNINRLNRVLEIDPVKRVVWLEPRVTMEQLAQATLKEGWMVPVIPEFKGITVGGALMGAGLESASHRHGLFSDSCLAVEVLLGNGTVVRATPEENSDLFYGIVGSYGSLGIVLSVELKLIPAQPRVKLHYIICNSLDDALRHLQYSPVDFVEGLVFDKDRIIIIEGSLTTEETNPLSLNHPWSEWFYAHAKKVPHDETVDLIDYLFRHDRGAFWIGSYGTNWTAIPGYFLESRLHLPWFGTKFKKPADPGFLFRLLWGWAMTSRRLYTWLHANSEEWVSNHFIIQDFCIPADHFTAFTTRVLDEIGITPLWLCPSPATKTPQIFSPHYSSHEKIVNVGIYGISPNGSPKNIVRKLEKWTQSMEGRKVLYSYSYYTPEEFWQIYPRAAYDQLRKKYHAAPWIDIDKKMIIP